MWDELGIAPCDDPKAIRRAYAARLKKLDPDRDPEAFARLRRALEWALGSAGRKDHAARRSSATSPPRARKAPKTRRPPPTPAPDDDDIRERALLVALNAALRRGSVHEATALYYRAAATGALSLENAPDTIERLLAVAVDDLTFDAAALRHLTRTVGLAAPQFRAPVAFELRQRVFARLHAEDWYEELLDQAKQRKGRAARQQAKIARLLLGRIGRYWNPDVEKTDLNSSIAQYKIHAAWLEDRIDPAWVRKIERRQARRGLFRLFLYGLFIGSMLIQSMALFAAGFIEDDGERFWAFMIGIFLTAFFFWVFMLIVRQILMCLIPGWTGFAAIARLKRARALWAGRSHAIWQRAKAKKLRDAG
ncbi:MAG TPA: hypothetical protein VGN55_15940 [Xanthobacteraceae bacterium]